MSPEVQSHADDSGRLRSQIDGREAGSGSSNQTGDMNSTASGDDVDSKQVEVVRLAAESQHMLPKKHDQTLVEVSVEHEKSKILTLDMYS